MLEIDRVTAHVEWIDASVYQLLEARLFFVHSKQTRTPASQLL